MELVYLWISKYKNIENQGFNLNSKWQVDYNDQTKELKIEKRNPQPIANFFGENISNVTAIVGENGSGKSTLLELLVRFSSTSIMEIKEWAKNGDKFTFIWAYYKDDKVYIYSNIDSINNSLKLKKSIFGIDEMDILQHSIYYSSIYDARRTILDRVLDDNAVNFKNISTKYLAYINGFSFSTDEINKQIEFVYWANKIKNNYFFINEFLPKYLIFEASEKCLITIIDFFEKIESFEYNEFDTIIIKFYKNLQQNTRNITKNISSKNRIKLNVILNFTGHVFFKFIRYLKADMSHILECKKDNTNFIDLVNVFIQAFYNKVDIKKFHFMMNYMSDLSFVNIITNENICNYFDNFNNVILKYRFKDTELYSDFFNEEWLSTLVLNNKEYLLQIDTFEEKNDKIVINKNDLFKFNSYIEIVLKYTLVFELYNINFRYNSIINFNWAINEQININEPIYLLSTGEYSILSILSRLYSAAQEKPITYIYVIDEGEVSLHPNWQTKYLNILINTINEYSTNKIHLILATHSPFVLSDLPRENVVFLEKDKDGKCQVVKNPMERPQTFASNIHTLFAEGFFMREGTIGHFAKSKIEKVLTYLSKDPKEMNDNEKNEYEEITKIINLIGEPLIKNKLLRMIQDRNTLTVDERINNLQAQIDELKKNK